MEFGNVLHRIYPNLNAAPAASSVSQSVHGRALLTRPESASGIIMKKI
jgi:hypothetical protein